LESSNTQVSSWNSESPHQTSNFNSWWTSQCRTPTLKPLVVIPNVDKKFRIWKFYFHSSLSVLSDDAESN
jgi:enoyl reductase-like protein